MPNFVLNTFFGNIHGYANKIIYIFYYVDGQMYKLLFDIDSIVL